MRRMQSVSLVGTTTLLILSIFLWAWSYRRGYIFRPDDTNQISLSDGDVVYWKSTDTGATDRWEDFDARKAPMTGAWIGQEMGGHYRFHFLGFSYGRFSTGARPVEHLVIVVPMWFFCTTLMTGRIWEVRRARHGQGRKGFPVERAV